MSATTIPEDLLGDIGRAKQPKQTSITSGQQVILICPDAGISLFGTVSLVTKSCFEVVSFGAKGSQRGLHFSTDRQSGPWFPGGWSLLYNEGWWCTPLPLLSDVTTPR
jgi:hypothetical protein